MTRFRIIRDEPVPTWPRLTQEQEWAVFATAFARDVAVRRAHREGVK